MKEIISNSTVLARLIRDDEWPEGLSFYSKDEEYIQVGKWNYQNGKELLAHKHNAVPRTFQRTQEVVYVRTGKIAARIYDEEGKLVERVELESGDTIVLLAGGHGYDILEDGTKVLEIKNGPYPGAEKDRTRY